MSTSHLISNAIYPYPMGDVEKYFQSMATVIEENSGVNDYRMVTHASYGISTPISANQSTKFLLTDSSLDIIDMTQGYISLDIELDYTMKTRKKDKDESVTGKYSALGNTNWFFLGFKSGAQIIHNYSVYSNGRLTACKQTKAKYEQTMVFNCKANDQKSKRPGMYSAPKNVLKMRNCVCGVYIRLPVGIEKTGEYSTNGNKIKFQVLVQVDDLLPFSAMEYFPRFACGNLELEISCNLDNNMVFCQIPFKEVMNAKLYGADEPTLNSEFTTSERMGVGATDKYKKTSVISTYALLDFDEECNLESQIKFTTNGSVNSKFNQCGDYARGVLGINADCTDISAIESTTVNTQYPFQNGGTDCYYTIIPSNLRITDAKSHVFGFNIKSESKANIMKVFENDGRMIIPAQWADQQTMPQIATSVGISANAPISLWECSELYFTFPNSPNQLTVSRNPFIDNIKVQLGSKIVPDKVMSTYSHESCEMTLAALKLDSLFGASNSLINSLVPKDHKCDVFVMNKEDDSDYMFVVDLERNGSGSYCDGVTGSNIALQIDGTFHHGTKNPHYYEYNAAEPQAFRYRLRGYAPSVTAISDAFWTFGPNGGEFIKDSSTISLTSELQVKRIQEFEETRRALEELMANIMSNGGTIDDMPRPEDIEDPVARRQLQREWDNFNNNVTNTTWATYLHNRGYVDITQPRPRYGSERRNN